MEHLPSQMDFPPTVFRAGRPVYIKIADLLVSYAGSIIASITIASTLSMGDLLNLGANLEILSDDVAVMLKRLPLILAAAGLLVSLAGLLLTPFKRILPPFRSLATAALFLAASFVGILLCDLHNHLFWALSSGVLCGILFGIGIPRIFRSNLAARLENCLIQVLGLSLAIFAANRAAGIYGIGLAAIGMTATAGMTLRLEESKTTTSIGSSALTAVALFLAYYLSVNAELSRTGAPAFLLTIADAKTAISLAIGLLLPFGIGALARFAGLKISAIASGLIGAALPFAVGILISPASLGMMLAGVIISSSLLALFLIDEGLMNQWQMVILGKLMGIVSLLIVPLLTK